MKKKQLTTRVIGGSRKLQLALLIEIRAGLGGRGRVGVCGFLCSTLLCLTKLVERALVILDSFLFEIRAESKCHVSLDCNLATKSFLFLLSHRANVNSFGG